MWEELEVVDVPEPTTSAWLHPSGAIVGIMRMSMLQPPYLWFQLGAASVKWLRSANDDLDELQRRLYEPVVLAESDDNEIARRFLRFMGFKTLDAAGLYMRSL